MMKVFKFLILFLVAAMAILPLVSCSDSSNPDGTETIKGEFYNPVLPWLSDPYVAQYNGNYYLAKDWGNAALGLFSSSTLSGLAYGPENAAQEGGAGKAKMIWPNDNSSKPGNISEFWASALFYYENYFYLYFPALDNTETNNISWGDQRRRMFVLSCPASDPFGGWTYEGRLDLPENCFAMDGRLCEINENLYFVWTGWLNNNSDLPYEQRLYICEMDNPTTVKAGTSRIDIARAEYGWETVEAACVQAPALIKQPNGKVKIIYTASATWSTGVCLGELTLTGDPMDGAKWVKTAEPFMTTDTLKGIAAPGCPSFVASPDGTETWMMYHASWQAGSGYDRKGMIQKIEFDALGDIVMNGPLGHNEAYTVPSGEVSDRYVFEFENGRLNGNAEAGAYAGARGGQAVKLTNTTSDDVELELDLSGEFYAYLRYKHDLSFDFGVTTKLNGQNNVFIYLRRSGGFFSMAIPSDGLPITLPEGGINYLTFKTEQANVVLDALILERK
jgi:GH43 family beta-xylosidase